MASLYEVDQVAVPSTQEVRFNHLTEHKYKRYYMCSHQSITLCLDNTNQLKRRLKRVWHVLLYSQETVQVGQ